jgi:hypothetical protein
MSVCATQTGFATETRKAQRQIRKSLTKKKPKEGNRESDNPGQHKKANWDQFANRRAGDWQSRARRVLSLSIRVRRLRRGEWHRRRYAAPIASR